MGRDNRGRWPYTVRWLLKNEREGSGCSTQWLATDSETDSETEKLEPLTNDEMSVGRKGCCDVGAGRP